MSANASVSEARVKRAFATFDYNNKGYISHDELERILRALGLRGMSKQLVATFMRTTSTRKNPAEVTYLDCLRILQNSAVDHIFEESFQVCQVLDKAETGRIQPEAMSKAARADGRYDAYVNTMDNPNSLETIRHNLRRASMGNLRSPLLGSLANNGSAAIHSAANTPTVTSKLPPAASGNTIDDDELTGGADRPSSANTSVGTRLGISALALSTADTNSTYTGSRKALPPASAKRQKVFGQIHTFVNRADVEHNTTNYGGGMGPLAASASIGLFHGQFGSALGMSTSNMKPLQDGERDPALTFDEWRQVQSSAEKLSDLAARRRRRNGPQSYSLASTSVRAGSNSSGISTPRGTSLQVRELSVNGRGQW